MASNSKTPTPEDRIPILCDMTPIEPQDQDIFTDGVIQLPELDLVTTFQNQESASLVYLSSFSNGDYFYTLSLNKTKVRDIHVIDNYLAIDVILPVFNGQQNSSLLSHAHSFSYGVI